MNVKLHCTITTLVKCFRCSCQCFISSAWVNPKDVCNCNSVCSLSFLWVDGYFLDVLREIPNLRSRKVASSSVSFPLFSGLWTPLAWLRLFVCTYITHFCLLFFLFVSLTYFLCCFPGLRARGIIFACTVVLARACLSLLNWRISTSCSHCEPWDVNGGRKSRDRSNQISKVVSTRINSLRSEESLIADFEGSPTNS